MAKFVRIRNYGTVYCGQGTTMVASMSDISLRLTDQSSPPQLTAPTLTFAFLVVTRSKCRKSWVSLHKR